METRYPDLFTKQDYVTDEPGLRDRKIDALVRAMTWEEN